MIGTAGNQQPELRMLIPFLHAIEEYGIGIIDYWRFLLMKKQKLTSELLLAFKRYLMAEELAEGTLEKYDRDLRAFASWAENQEITKDIATGWKENLISNGYAPATVNSMLAAVNTFFRFAGWHDCRMKFLKIQRKMFREQNKELTQTEFRKLVNTAAGLGRVRQALLLETIGSTGIRVSEVRYITIEAAQQGRAEITLKGKIRTILLSSKLCHKLLKYAKKKKIASGEIFLTRNGKGLSRKQIWAEMKWLCKKAGVAASKVFPHNLRHLFATTFYKASKDIAKLADVLGHTSVETTRIYLLSTGAEHIRQLNSLGLVS